MELADSQRARVLARGVDEAYFGRFSHVGCFDCLRQNYTRTRLPQQTLVLFGQTHERPERSREPRPVHDAVPASEVTSRTPEQKSESLWTNVLT